MVKDPPANAGDTGSIPGSGRSPGEGNGNPLQYSCLGNPMDRSTWWVTVHGVTEELDTTWQLYNNQPNISVSHSVVPDSLRPHGLQPTRLLCP